MKTGDSKFVPCSVFTYMGGPKVRSQNISNARRVVSAFMSERDGDDKLAQVVTHQQDDAFVTGRGREGGLNADEVEVDDVFLLESVEGALGVSARRESVWQDKQAGQQPSKFRASIFNEGQ